MGKLIHRQAIQPVNCDLVLSTTNARTLQLSGSLSEVRRPRRGPSIKGKGKGATSTASERWRKISFRKLLLHSSANIWESSEFCSRSFI